MENPRELVSAYDSETFGKDGSFRLDKPVGSASISPCGRDVVLASRQGLHIIDLDSPWSPPRHLAHHTPWEVADVQWSPFAIRDYWVVSTSNQKALVWNLAMINTRSSVEHVLHAHSRAITDINFSAHHPDILATCAVDSFVHCWDLRHPSRPALTFCDWFAGATQVKWNRQDPHILASSHDRNLRIWDDRKGAYPLRSIEAHTTKIYGVDWNRLETKYLVTCSLDKTIKVWDYTKTTDEPDRVIHTPYPVWRARHTPFGSGLLAMPQRGDNDLHLYDRRIDEIKGKNHTQPLVHRFSGHQDQVKEFLWRPRGNVTSNVDDRDFQLVSWGTDKLLRLHEVNKEVLGKVGYQKGMEVKRTMNSTRKDAVYKTFRDDPLSRKTIDSQDSPIKTQFRLEHGTDSPGMSSMSTAGISRASLPFIGGYGLEGFVSSGRSQNPANKNDMDPISWMRGVKIGKHDSSPSGMHQSTSAILSPSLKADPSWENFESLGEEITASGDRFPKVNFDEIDVQRRRVALSLSGPWAVDGTSTYIKCLFNFPSGYPTSAAPKLSLEKTASASDEALTKVSDEVNDIADAFMSHQRNSLEAILRYLLGEQSKDESLLWLKKHRDSDDLNLALEPELSSSDEDDEGLGKYIGPQEHGLESSDLNIAVSNAQYNVPLPKACGALWAHNGLLVCFFPVKQEKESSLLNQSLGSIGRFSKGRKTFFEGFGRFNNDSNRSNKADSTLETVESGGSDYEDCDSSSSGSSSFSEGLGPAGYHFMPTMAWRGNMSESRQDLSIDGSQKSNGEARATASSVPKDSMLVVLHDYSDILPAKRQLANEYCIGNTHGDADHNAQVASENGCPGLADVWAFTKLILQDRVPLMALHNLQGHENIMVVVRRALSPLKEKDSAIDLSFDTPEEDLQLNRQRPIKWGDHPLGRRWLVTSLLMHYERSADLQMLAMLSCAFSEPPVVSRKPDEESRWPNATRMPQRGHLFPQRVKPSPGYYPSEEVAMSLLESATSGLSIRFDSQRVSSGPHSANSSTGALASDPSATSSGSGTPPYHRPFRSNFERKDSQTVSLSTSPEQHRHVHRSNSNLSVFAASFQRPFPISQSAASSPPNTHPKKRLSPAGSYLGPTQSSINWAPSTWGGPGFFGRPTMGTVNPRTALSLAASDTEDENLVNTSHKVTFTTTLKNQDKFCNDGYSNVPLLDPNREDTYREWRATYAEMLYAWEIPIARCQILGYNPQLSLGPQTLPIGRSLSSSIDANAGDIQPKTHCRNCSALLPISLTSSRCIKCRHLQGPASCLLCNSYIRGLSSPCLSCGHVMHAACRAVVNESGMFDECISGCGCICSEHASVRMPMPEAKQQTFSRNRDGNPAVTVVADAATNEQEQLGWREGNWDDVAYESLARNLQGQRRGSGRRLRATTSQIWRGSQ